MASWTAKAMDGLNVSMSQLDSSRLRDLVDIIGDGKGEIDAFNDNYKRAQQELTKEFRLTQGEAVGLLNAIENMASAKGPEAVAAASRRLNGLLLTIYGTVQDIPPKFRDMAEGAAKVDVAASEIIGTLEGVAGASSRLARSAEADAQKMLAKLQAEITLRETVLRYGKDSVQVAALTAAQGHDVYIEYLKTLDVTESMKAELLAAHDKAAALAATDMTPGIAAAAGSAAQLAKNLNISLQAASRILALGGGKKQVILDPRDPRFDPVAAEMEKIKGEYGRVSPFDPARNTPPKTRTGSATTAIDKQRKAVEDLIAQQQLELALLRETDPVRQEMLRNREALAGATDAERGEVEKLIAARIREQAAMERLQWVSDQTGNSLIDALMGGANAGEKLIETLKRAALEALVLGKGPLAGMFGMSGSLVGGLFGGFDLFSGPAIGTLGLPFADGGMIHGPGSGTSDEVPIWASNGEFMMNARATARYRHLLEAMNSGSPVPGFGMPAFAAGGAIGGGAAPGGGFNAASAPQINLDLRGVQGSDEVERRAYEGMKAALKEYDREILPGSFARIKRDPRRTN